MTATVHPIAAYLPDWMVFASDPLDGVREALLLLSSGRAAMAMRVLEGLPEPIEAEKRAVYSKGRRDAEVAMVAQPQPKAPSPSPAGPHRHKWLQSVADLRDAPRHALP